MPNLATALRAEIRATAGRELAVALAPLHRIEKDLKVLIALLKQRRTAPAGGGYATAVFPARPAGRPPKLSGGDTLRPAEVVAIRRRFGLNRVQFGRLVGVSTWTVFMWEHGKVAPSSDSAARLRHVAKMNPKAAFARAVKPKGRR